MTRPTITALHAILAAHEAPQGPSKADTIKAVAACLSGACAAPQCEPSIKQLSAQLQDYDEKWTPEEQRQFAVFLHRFPNESSAGIMSLGSAWKHGKAIAQPVAAQGGITISATAAQEIRAPIANLAAVVRVQNGNLHEDTYSLLTHADKAIAILAAKAGAV